MWIDEHPLHLGEDERPFNLGWLAHSASARRSLNTSVLLREKKAPEGSARYSQRRQFGSDFASICRVGAVQRHLAWSKWPATTFQVG